MQTEFEIGLGDWEMELNLASTHKETLTFFFPDKHFTNHKRHIPTFSNLTLNRPGFSESGKAGVGDSSDPSPPPPV